MWKYACNCRTSVLIFDCDLLFGEKVTKIFSSVHKLKCNVENATLFDSRDLKLLPYRVTFMIYFAQRSYDNGSKLVQYCHDSFSAICCKITK